MAAASANSSTLSRIKRKERPDKSSWRDNGFKVLKICLRLGYASAIACTKKSAGAKSTRSFMLGNETKMGTRGAIPDEDDTDVQVLSKYCTVRQLKSDFPAPADPWIKNTRVFSLGRDNSGKHA